MTSNPYQTFELRRLNGDEVTYIFDRMPYANGADGYKRRDQDLWIVYMDGWGWVAWGEAYGITGRPWYVPPEQQADFPPEGEWVSKKGPKSYVYQLTYLNNL